MTRTDRDHLRALAICHYVLGGLCFFLGGFAIVYLAIGIALVAEAPAQPVGNGQDPPAFLGWLFVGIGAFVFAFDWLLAAGLVLAGRCLDRRKGRTFCLVMAGISCLFQPLGLVLGIFTFVVLLRPSVRDAFEPVREEPPEHDTYHSE